MKPETAAQVFVNKYSSIGEKEFYKFLINYALGRISDIESKTGYNPANELIDYSDMFLKLHRRENNVIYLELSRHFKKVAHKIYRIILKKKLIDKSNKFLNEIQ